MNTFSRRVEDVFSVTFFVFRDIFLKISLRRLVSMSGRRLAKRSWRCLEDIFGRHLANMPWRRLGKHGKQEMFAGKIQHFGKKFNGFQPKAVNYFLKKVHFFMLGIVWQNHIFKLLFKSILCQQTLLWCWIVKTCSCKFNLRLSINNKNETIQLMKRIRSKTQRKTVAWKETLD